ncbi:MAG TPA: cupin domain-containing protein [Candidatus Saccharimonadales bacterium]|nr:cupin domain-containing protein [Candidatus Saccharimonadales bacterium]
MPIGVRTMRKPFKKSLKDIPVEEAHGGSGSRQLLLSKKDPVSSQMEAMTKGFLPVGKVFDWHRHENIDELFLVIRGTGIIQFEDGTEMQYRPDDLIYIPSNTKHRIENNGKEENQFYFVRLNH